MKTSIGQTVIILILLAAATAWAGAIYRWVDDNGVVHYSDGAPDGDNFQGDIETRQAVPDSPLPASGGKETAPPASVDAPPPAPRPQAAVVEIYTTSWCRYCKDAKNYFRKRGIAFNEYDIEKDRAAARRHRRYNPRGGVPVTVINGQAIVGFAPAAFARALKES